MMRAGARPTWCRCSTPISKHREAGATVSIRYCFIAPTYRGDLDRFQLLRDSIVAMGQGHVPHYALIDTEDLPLLQSLNLPGVIPLTTAELLAPEVEAGRIAYLGSAGSKRWKRFQRSLYKRFGLFPNTRYYGWHIQQLLKLAACAQLPYDVFVSFDSDIIVTQPFDIGDFVQNGRPVLYERQERLTQPHRAGGWFGHACTLLDAKPPTQPGDLMIDYVSQPFVFERRVMLELFAWLEKRYGRPWWDCILAQPLGDWSEFMTYGMFVRKHLEYRDVCVRPLNEKSLWIETDEQIRDADRLIERAFADPQFKFLVLQSDPHAEWQLSRFEARLRSLLNARRAR
jgi:hypothetical protein